MGGRRIAAGIAAAGLACTGLVLTAPAASAATFEVTSGADDGSEGTFRWAVTQAGATPGADVVNVAASVTAITLDDCVTGRVEIAPTGLLTVNGNGTTITQTCVGAGVLGGIGDTTLNDLTLTGGDSLTNGGAIELNGGLTLDGVTLRGNAAAGSGGAVFTVGATIIDSTIADNAAEGSGGAVSLSGGGDLEIEGSTIEDNAALVDGGGIIADGDLTVTDSTLARNAALGDGGGALVNGFATITDSVIEENAAEGAIGGVGAEVVSVVGSTVTYNVAAETIGGIGGDTVSVVRSSVFGNGAPLAGGIGAVLSLSVDTSTIVGNVGGGLDSAGPIDLAYATIVGNGGANITSVGVVTSWASVVADAATADCVFNGGSMSSEGYNFGGDASCGFTGTGDTNGGGDPELGPLDENEGPTLNMVPQSGSPLLNKVPSSDAACSATDQRGFARPANGACDVGAVEVRQVSSISQAVTTPYQTSVVTDLVPLVTDPDGVLAIYEVEGAINGFLDAADGGQVTYTPDIGFSGADAYDYVVCSFDEVICTSPQTISITVGAGPVVPAAPVAVTPSFTG